METSERLQQRIWNRGSLVFNKPLAALDGSTVVLLAQYQQV
jgi:hydroxyacyl-ACP dehydratase HTD2-like protein with hotdog domain